MSGIAVAQPSDAVDPAAVLKRSASLQDVYTKAQRKAQPAFVLAQDIEGKSDQEVIAKGEVELRKGDTVLKADRMRYERDADMASGQGQVRMNRAGNVYTGTAFELQLESQAGYLDNAQYRFLRNNGQGTATRVTFVDENQSVAHKANYTTCEAGDVQQGAWKPSWILTADKVAFDLEQDSAVANGATLRFKDMPLVPLPPVSFPMSDKRKSGFLAPTVTVDSQSGLEVVQPYYWNIAPHQDLTLSPVFMSKRGVALGSEYRYLQPQYGGGLRIDVMPHDLLRDDANRWGLAWYHAQSLTSSLWGSPIALKVNINRVSDPDYWRDFPRGSPSLTQRLLPNDLSLISSIAGWTTQLRSSKWQVLQDTADVITPPFDRLPQLNTKRVYNFADGLFASVEGDVTSFRGDTTLTGQPNGRRWLGVGQIYKSYVAPAGAITPRLQVHARTYQFDANNSNTFDRTEQRVIPTFSLDSNLVFERSNTLFDRAVTQTLEPRAYYLRTPFRDQNGLPNYDGGAKDLSFSSLFSDNTYSGNDRIADAHLLAMGVSTRYLSTQTGAEMLRLGLAQRYRFNEQLVTLPSGTPDTEQRSDWLMQATLNMDNKWRADATVQYGVKSHVSERTTLSTQYSPTPYRNLYGAYRLQRGVSEQVDVGWQWPLNDLWREPDAPGSNSRAGLGPRRWYSVGRLNYSITDRRLVDAIVGMEYDADCWLGRLVLEQIQTSATTSNRRIMFQLELVGLTRLGVSPLSTLKRSIPRYQNLREEILTPSRFSQYE